MLKQTFFEVCSAYTGDNDLIELSWREIHDAYNSDCRHYHNFSHLESIHAKLQAVQEHCTDWHAMIMALFYHDVVYNSLRSDNEEKSAAFALKALSALGLPESVLAKVRRLILATKGHMDESDADTNIFLDADLSILGSDEKTYQRYSSAIRMEYGLVPDLVYKSGRRKVLKGFLKMPAIFKTPYFHRLEGQARKNLLAEVATL